MYPSLAVESERLSSEMLVEELTPFGPRLVIPVEERDVGHLPAVGLEEA